MTQAIGLSTHGMTKIFGDFTALEDVSIDVPAGDFHALLGENGAGKSTLVKCMMGYQPPTRGKVMLDGKDVAIASPRAARDLGIGMVYQHFTLVPSFTAAENLVVARGDVPGVIDWKKERAGLDAFLETTPFRVPLDRPVSELAAGEKQKLEILKLLYLDQRFLILDEPTSVLTPGEADEMLGLLRDMADRGLVSVLMITHKFREVNEFARSLSVLRRGRLVGTGKVGAVSSDDMAKMMVGDAKPRPRAARISHVRAADAPRALDVVALYASDDAGTERVRELDLHVAPGEILGVAGVSGNGQSEFVEALTGQRPIGDGRIFVHGQPFEPTREQFARLKVFGLPEEPLRNAAVPRMSVAENMALRSFDRPPIAGAFGWLRPATMRARARDLVERYRVKTVSVDAPIETLSGGNVQRAILARELSEPVDLLIVVNPCFGLDFSSAAEIRTQIVEARNRGAAVLLVSEDLDEILELSDRVAVMSQGRIAMTAPVEATDRNAIGHAMAGH
jgi:general nucleoside transport system ATP-binding protein